VEVARVRGVHGQVQRDGDRSDHGVVRTSLRRSTATVQAGRYLAERPRRRRVERQGLEVRLRLLQHGLAAGSLALRGSHERADRQLRQRDAGDARLRRQCLS
jgi:hypothetical protein